MMINPIEELIEKKLASKKKFETQVEDARDSVRRATNKLEEKVEGLARRTEELDTLQEINELVVKTLERKEEINSWFKKTYEGHITLDEYVEQIEKDNAAKEYGRTPSAPKEMHETMNEYYGLDALIEEQNALARKVFYNR